MTSIKNLKPVGKKLEKPVGMNLNSLNTPARIMTECGIISTYEIEVDKLTVNRGKSFENEIRKQLERVNGVSVDRIHDQTTGFCGSRNICDIIAYRYPNEFYFECKTVHGNVLPFSNISDNQWTGLIEKSTIPGVYAGIICWWVDKDITAFIPAQLLHMCKLADIRSIRYDLTHSVFGRYRLRQIKGKKKRVFFDYDMEGFLDELQFNSY